MKLVKVVYRATPEGAIAETYYRDREGRGDEFYEKALRQWFPSATIESVTRGVDPVEQGGHCA